MKKPETMNAKIRTLNTDKITFNKYVAAGYWTPTGEVKWHKNCAGIVTAEVQMAKRRGDDSIRTETVSLIIEKYFTRAITSR